MAQSQKRRTSSLAIGLTAGCLLAGWVSGPAIAAKCRDKTGPSGGLEKRGGSQVLELIALASLGSLKAERSGFEPEMPVSRHTGLAIRRFRPLSHLSGSLAAWSREGPANSANIVRNQPKSKVIRGAARRVPPIFGLPAPREHRAGRRRWCRGGGRRKWGRETRAAKLLRPDCDPSFGTRPARHWRAAVLTTLSFANTEDRAGKRIASGRCETCPGACGEFHPA